MNGNKKSSRALRSLLLALVVCALSLGLPVTAPAFGGDCVGACLDISIQCSYNCFALYGAGTPAGDACDAVCMDRQGRCLFRCMA
jgi:hypothetical protein